MFRPIRSVMMALTAALALSACAPTAQNTAASLAEEQRRSQQHVRDLDGKGGLIKTATLNNYLRSIVDRTVPGSGLGSGQKLHHQKCRCERLYQRWRLHILQRRLDCGHGERGAIGNGRCA